LQSTVASSSFRGSKRRLSVEETTGTDMAKLSMILKNKRRAKTAAKYANKLASLKKVIKDPKSSTEQVEEAYQKMQKLPRDSSKTRIRNRCELTGRPRAYLRKFGLSRIAMRDLARRGDLPGVTKSSW